MKLSELQETDWYKERPIEIQKAVDQCPPICKYMFKDSKKQCLIIGYDEPEGDEKEVTLIVQKTGEGGALAEMGMGMLDTNQVFGVSLNDLEPIN